MVHCGKFQENNLPLGQMNLLFRARIIWRDIATWTRAYLVGTYLDSDPEFKQAVMEKINNLPLEQGGVFRLYFGDQSAEEYTTLLSDYINTLISLIDAQKSGGANAINELTRQLYQIIDLRVDFLSKLNPFWQKNIISDLTYNFTNMTIAEATSFLKKDYKQSIDIFSRVLSHTTNIGDYIAEGLIKYFTYSANPKTPEF